MFSFLAPYKLGLQIGAVIIIIGSLLLGYSKFKGHQQQIGYDRAVKDYTGKLLEYERVVRAREQALMKQIEDARNEATLRNQEIDKLSHSTSLTVDSLRNTINSLRNKLPTNTPTANRIAADTSLELFGECTKEYRDMAEKADRHASDVKMLQDAWPR